MTIKTLSKGFQVLYFVSLVLLMSIFNIRETISTQSNQFDEIIVTVNPAIPVTPDITPSEYRFETNYLISRIDVNQFNASVKCEIPEGAISWGSISGFSIRNVTIFDNLGNRFDPVFKDDSVCNRKAEIVLPPLFEHKISLSFETDQGITFNGENKKYLLHFIFGYPRPASLNIRFPNNFTVLECDIGSLDTIPSNVSKHRGSKFVTLKCDIRGEAFNIFVRFVPFCRQGIVKSFKFTLDIPEVSPMRGCVKGTYEQVFVTPASFSIWDINPFFAIPIPFPKYAENLTVEKVWDGLGDCKQISEPVENLSNNSLGYYYLDNKNREVIVYPRYHYY